MMAALYAILTLICALAAGSSYDGHHVWLDWIFFALTWVFGLLTLLDVNRNHRREQALQDLYNNMKTKDTE